MRTIAKFLIALVFLSTGSLASAQDDVNSQDSSAEVDARRLPTGRAITPAGEVISFHGRPVDLEISKYQKLLFVKDRNHLRVIDAKSFEMVDAMMAPGGASLFGLATDSAGHIYFTNARNHIHIYRVNENRKLEFIDSIELAKDSFPCGICLSEDEKILYVCLSKKNAIAIVEIATKKTAAEIAVGIAPFDVLQIGEQLVVSNLGGRRPQEKDQTATSAGSETVVDDRGIASTGTLSVVSIAEQRVTSEIAVGLHPSVLSQHAGRAIVCNTNQDSLSVVDLANKAATTIDVKPDEKLPFGSMPSSLCWLPDQKHLLVALAGNNAIAVFQHDASGKLTALGHLPTAWFPAGIAHNDEYVFVANIKGFGARSKVRDAAEGRNSHDHAGVVQRIAIADILDQQKLDAWSKQVAENSKLALIVRNQVLYADEADVAPKAVPEKLGQPSLFKHVIYVIKENRTFDQVFGDYKEARSDPRLCLFPRDVTPNHHALADRFGILDNYYCNAVLSADGHSWATEGNVTPYLERAFGGFNRSYTFGDDPITYSSSGFVWDHVLAAGLSFRNYGEMDYAEPPGKIKYQEIFRKYEAGEPIEFTQRIGIDRLRKYSCRDYPGWNMDIPDVLRMDRFIKEFREFEKEGGLPNLCIVYLPQDHLGASGVTSRAHMADNDLALGRLVDVVSHSRFWKETVIFVNEDDPQNGFDHIDGHRSICLVISPFSKPGVNHHFYNQTSVLRTILHTFGLPPMNQQDAAAPLMAECFQQESNVAVYDAITPETKLNGAPNKQSLWSPQEKHWRAVLATVPIQRTGMKTEQDEDHLNRFIWHDVKGWETPYPVQFAGPHGQGLKKLGLKIDASGEKD